MSSPPPSSTPARPKRRRSFDRGSSPSAGPSGAPRSSPPPSSLPPSSPPAPFSDFDEDVEDDEADARERGRRDLPDDETDDEGEDLFNDDVIGRDYEENPELDSYSQADIDDRESLPEMSRAERLAAEREMRRRDRGLPGTRAAGRERMPGFLQSDDEDDGAETGVLAGINTRRTRRQYDERMDEDDVAEDVGVDGVC